MLEFLQLFGKKGATELIHDENASGIKVTIEQTRIGGAPPSKANPTDSGFDLTSPVDVYLEPGGTKVVWLGWKMQMPDGWEAQIRGRSSLSKDGLQVQFGTVDCSYRKEVGVTIYNGHRNSRLVRAGSRIAQMVFARVPEVEIVGGEVEDTDRGGFGSTGA